MDILCTNTMSCITLSRANDMIDLYHRYDNSFHCANIASCSELNDILKILN